MPEDSIAMHAVVAKANASANAKGTKTYRLVFSYPRGFLSAVDEVLGMDVDVYWNEELVANQATVVGARQKPIKDEDPVYYVDLDADPGDTSLANMADAVNDAGDLRFKVTQGVLFGPGT